MASSLDTFMEVVGKERHAEKRGPTWAGDMLDTSTLDESSIACRQAEWDRQLESVDQRQAELLGTQWRLVREQTGVLARELASLQQQFGDFKLDSRRALIEIAAHARQNESRIAEESGLRLAKCHSLDQCLRKVEDNVELQARQHAAHTVEVSAKLVAYSEALAARTRDLTLQAQDIQMLRDALSANAKDLDSLKETTNQEVSERKLRDGTTEDLILELRGRLLKEVDERVGADKGLMQTMRAVVEQEMTDRSLAHGALRGLVSTLEADLLPIKEASIGMGSRMQEVERLVEKHSEAIRRGLEREANEHTVAYDKLHQQLADISSGIDVERAALMAQIEEAKHALGIFQAKMSSQLAERAEDTKLLCEKLHGHVLKLIDHEAAEREAQLAALGDQLSAQQTFVDKTYRRLESSLRDVEQQCHDTWNIERRDREAGDSRLLENLAGQVRELKGIFNARLAEERVVHLGFLDRSLQSARELVLRGSWQQRHLARRKTLDEDDDGTMPG